MTRTTRQRLSPAARRTAILETAGALFAAKGYGATEMEDIRRAAGLSRGGLYHHFSNKNDLLGGIIHAEIDAIAQSLRSAPDDPISALLAAGSAHLGAPQGVLDTLSGAEELRAYLAHLDQAISATLSPVLAENLRAAVAEGVAPAHVAELFLTVNAQINRRQILGDWSAPEAASFAATALGALAPLLADPEALAPLIARLATRPARQETAP